MVDDAFGYWLSGLIDGEGCFNITHIANTTRYRCRFGIRLRDDDIDTLHQIATVTQLGFVFLEKPSKPNGNGTAKWDIQRKEHLLTLIDLLDRFPLQSKKRRDYETWKEAVILWTSGRKGNRYHGPRDWSKIAALREQLMRERKHPSLQHPPRESTATTETTVTQNTK